MRAALLLWFAGFLVTAGAAPPRDDPPRAGELQWWTTHALDKVRPRDRPQEPGPIELLAARNEFEPFQLVLRAHGAPIEEVDVSVSDLVGPGGARIGSEEATVYVERYLQVRTPSSVEGAAGEWPDALVPAVDRYAGEKRRAFPLTLEPGRNQPVWIDLYVPRATPPGDYRGQVVARVEGATRVEAPIALRVLPFELPSTSSLPTSFGFSGISALQQHYGGYTDDADLFAITEPYTTALLRHRISSHGGSLAPPEWTASEKKVSVRWQRYDREVTPYLDGTVFGDGDPLPGARVTSIDVRTPPGLPTEESRVLYWREWVRHFEQRGWLDRLFLYMFDEPGRDEHYGKVLGIGREARQATPELRTLLTEQLAAPLADVVDIWATPVNCIEPRPGIEPYCEETVPRRAYAAAERQGRRVWWYQSCMSHGCNTIGERPAFTDWPSYVVDVDPVANRIMPWLAFRYDITGELYYNTVEGYNAVASPWDDQLHHGGNGDGTLFYPGTPKRIGGRTHIPIESLRLKLIREGLEDYEYLVLLEQRGGAELARKQVARIAQSVFQWDRRPEALYAARKALAEMLAADRHSRPGASR